MTMTGATRKYNDGCNDSRSSFAGKGPPHASVEQGRSLTHASQPRDPRRTAAGPIGEHGIRHAEGQPLMRRTQQVAGPDNGLREPG